MVKVFTAGTEDEAILMHGRLVDAGIPAVVHGSSLSGVGPSRAEPFSPTVWIQDEKDEQQAREVIQQNQPAPTHCRTCGYDLRGLPERRCPECGEPFTRRSPATEWTCPKCGEAIEGQFTECWKCGSERPEQVG